MTGRKDAPMCGLATMSRAYTERPRPARASDDGGVMRQYSVGVRVSAVYQYEVAAESLRDAEKQAIDLAKRECSESGYEYEIEYTERPFDLR